MICNIKNFKYICTKMMRNNLKLKYFLSFLLMLLTIPLVAQEMITVKGTVKEPSGEVLIGASVMVQGAKNGTITDLEGKYTVNVPANGILVFSYIGYTATKVNVNGKKEINITLMDGTKELTDAVVIGYGTSKKIDLTGPVGSISSDAIDKSVVTTADQVLQGRMAGVQVVQNSGIPGGGNSIMIRGIGSINSTNEPIYVIDGVIIAPESGSIISNPLASINPADIESMDVLKDASATAIYGAQGANGVVLITMKKGKTIKPVVNFNYYVGNQQLANKIDMLNLQEFATHYNDVYYTVGNGLYKRDDFSSPETLGKGTDWQDVIFRNALMKNYNLSVRGSDKGTSYSISGGYFSQDGIAITSDFKRTTFRLDVTTKANEWLKFGSTVNVGYNTQNTGIASWNTIPYALYSSPQIAAYNSDGTFGGPMNDQEYGYSYGNPLAAALNTTRFNEKFNTRGNAFVTVNPYKWLSYKMEFSGELGLNNYNYFLPFYMNGNYVGNSTTQNEHSKLYSINWTWRNLVNFDYTFNKIHKVTAVLGHEVNYNKSDYLWGKRQNGSLTLTGLDAGDANYDNNSGYSSDRKFVSLFGRLFYSYRDRYLFTGSLRNDGSSNFSKGRKWGLFPSAAFAWRASEEDFFEPLKDKVDNLKFRLSFGKVGNSNVGAFAYESMLENVQSNWGVSLKTMNIANQELTWESTNSWNAGIDINLFKNRIELVFDTYIRQTDNLLLQAQLPSYLGTSGSGSASAPWLNIGSIENKGFEFSINTKNMAKQNFTWTSSLTFSAVKNKVTKMNTEAAIIDKSYQATGTYTDVITRTTVGQPISQFYGYVANGRINSAADFLTDNGDGTSTVTIATRTYQKGQIISNTAYNQNSTFIGDLIFKDINEDGIIDSKDKTFIGNPLPKFTTGFTNNFTFKNFDLSLFLYASVGNKVFNMYRVKIDDPNVVSNVSSRVLNYAKLGFIDGNSTNTNIWNQYVLPGADPSQVRMEVGHTNLNHAISTRFVEDGSFLRVQNISFGYTIPAGITRKIKINKLRVYSNVQNLFTFTKYTGFDPEVGSTQGQYSTSGQGMLMYGVDASRMPSPRTYTFGLDITL